MGRSSERVDALITVLSAIKNSREELTSAETDTIEEMLRDLREIDDNSSQDQVVKVTENALWLFTILYSPDDAE